MFTHDQQIERQVHPENFEPLEDDDGTCGTCGHMESEHSTGPKQVCIVDPMNCYCVGFRN